jgi:carbonic anhydrase
MQLQDYEKRWTYHGSLTTPPCTPAIFWNVIDRVWPIEPQTLSAFLGLMEYNRELLGSGTNNNRVI